MCFKFLAVPAVMLAALSCSIKEDRSKCPCILIMDLEEVPWNTPEEGFPLSLQVSGPGGFSLENPVSVEECSTSYTVEGPRQGVYSSLLTSPAGDFFVGGRGIVIPEGKDCPPLWMYSRFLDTSVEDIREKVVLRKSFCTMSVTFKGVPPGKYSLRFLGTVCGYDLSAKPVPGEFSYLSVPDGGGTCSARIPRQTDSSLIAAVESGDMVLRYFAIGEILAKNGYDWTSPDLADASLTIDYASTAITLTIGGGTPVQVEVLI